MMQESITFFISYAHEDDHLRQEFDKHLSLLKWQLVANVWHDRKINAGADWVDEINTHMESAQVILLLISPDFMASEYCYGVQMKRAMERHQAGITLVIPVILRPVDWEGSPFSHLKVLPTNAAPIVSSKWHSQDEAFLNVVQSLRSAIKDLIPLPTNIDNSSLSKQQELHSVYRTGHDEIYVEQGEVLQFIYGSDSAFADLENRARRACIVFEKQPTPKGTSPKAARVGFEVDPNTGEALLLIDKGLTYSGSNAEVEAWITSGTKHFPNFTLLREWIRHELAGAY
jgi:TIR domain